MKSTIKIRFSFVVAIVIILLLKTGIYLIGEPHNRFGYANCFLLAIACIIYYELGLIWLKIFNR